MGTLIVVDCEAPFGVGAPSIGDMTEFGAVDVNALRDGRVETFHGVDCSEDTFRQFLEWLDPRKPVVFVSDNPAYDFQWINFYFWKYLGENPFGHSGRRIADFYARRYAHFDFGNRAAEGWKDRRRRIAAGRTMHDHADERADYRKRDKQNEQRGQSDHRASSHQAPRREMAR